MVSSASKEDALHTSLYVHFDTDILKLKEAPAHGYPAPGGPSSSILEAFFRRLARSGQVMTVSMTTWNPRLDRDEGSRRVCTALLETSVRTKE
jgi:arginase family enzyme